MAFRRIGNWQTVTNIIATMPQELEKAKRLSLRRWSLKAEGLAKGHMSAQDLGWTPLKAKTVAQKLREGKSELILIATSSYFQSITSWVKEDTAYAGVRKGIKGKDGQQIDAVAAVHEYGSPTKNIPARPLWKPTFDETMKWHNSHNMPEKLFYIAIRAKLGYQT